MITLFGLCGVFLILLAFTMSLLKKWTVEMTVYLITNLIGCIITTWYDLITGPTPFLILQIVWGLFALIKLCAKKKVSPWVPDPNLKIIKTQIALGALKGIKRSRTFRWFHIKHGMSYATLITFTLPHSYVGSRIYKINRAKSHLTTDSYFWAPLLAWDRNCFRLVKFKYLKYIPKGRITVWVVPTSMVIDPSNLITMTWEGIPHVLIFNKDN